MKKVALAAAVGLGVTATPALAAPTLGDTLSCTSSAFSCSSSRATMGSGAEFTGNVAGFAFLSFDFSQGLLTIRNTNPWGDFGFYGNMTMNFQDLTSAFSNVSLMSQSGFTNLSAANFSVSGGVLSFSSTGFSARSNGSLVLQVGNAPAVPEPAAWTMMILGFGVAGYALRQRRAHVAVAA